MARPSMLLALTMMVLVQSSMANTWVVGGPLGWGMDALAHVQNPTTFYQNWVESNIASYNNDLFGKRIFLHLCNFVPKNLEKLDA